MKKVFCDLCGNEMQKDTVPALGTVRGKSVNIVVMIIDQKDSDVCVSCRQEAVKQTFHMEASASNVPGLIKHVPQGEAEKLCKELAMLEPDTPMDYATSKKLIVSAQMLFIPEAAKVLMRNESKGVR